MEILHGAYRLVIVFFLTTLLLFNKCTKQLWVQNFYLEQKEGLVIQVKLGKIFKHPFLSQFD
jgi:hypothetical protein